MKCSFFFIVTSLFIFSVVTQRVCFDSFDLNLAVNDLNEIKSRALLCSYREDCYLVWNGGIIEDHVAIQAVPNFFGLPVFNFTQDLTPPELIQFTFIDLDNGRLSLRFSEFIIPSSVNFTSLTLISFPIETTNYFSLTGGAVLSTNTSAKLLIQLSSSDLNELKQQTGFCTFVGNCYISINSSFILDTNNNSIVFTDFTDALRVQSLIPDSTSPILLFWDIDLDSGNVTLTFDESVQFRELSFAAITISANSFPSQPNYTLAGGILLSTENLPIIRFSVLYNDLNILKSMVGLFISINSTFLYYSATLIKDMNENFIEFFNPLVPSNIYRDLSPPELQIFDILDLNRRTIILIFTEPVNITTVLFTRIYLQETLIGGEELYLTNGSLLYLSEDLRTIELNLSPQDILSLKLFSKLGKSIDSTFILLDDGAFADISGNPISSSAPIKEFTLQVGRQFNPI